MFKIGEINVKDVHVGKHQVSKLYVGNTEIWKQSPSNNWVTFTAQAANSTIGLNKLSTNQTLEYSTDGDNWTSMTTATTITLSNSGDSVYIRGVLSGNNTSEDYTQFRMTGTIAASNNCNYLWNYSNPNAPLKQFCGCFLFRNCTSLTTVPELPTTTLATGCYGYMFSSCTSLTTPPELPATTLAYSCYQGIFANCTSLTTAPELPATTLVYGCYSGMFNGCTSLTTAPELLVTTLVYGCYTSMFNYCTSLATSPELPATTLAIGCYSGMFSNCTSLTTAPELPATILKDYCYSDMFRGCTNLNYIKCLATDISATDCTKNWVNSVSNSGTFVKNSEMSSWTTGNNGIPVNWSVEYAE